MVEKYIIDKSDIHKLLTGQDIELDNGSKVRAFFVEIQGNPTNGDIIKAIFPNIKFYDRTQVTDIVDGEVFIGIPWGDYYNGANISADEGWLNYPYKAIKEVENEEE